MSEEGPDQIPGWDELAAPGTDPDLLAAVVHRISRPGVGAASLLGEALEHDRDATPAAALRRAASTVQPDTSDAASIRDAWGQRGVRVALLGDRAYPQRLLLSWPDPSLPLLLAYRGDVARLDRERTVAIVGARRATGYGRGVAAWLAEACADSGVHVISGGAVGIDATAHGAALDNGTTVVLGCGHDVDYPREHAQPRGLFARILGAGGALLSEQLPHTSPKPGVVRARNRIVAGLSDAVVVVEGSRRSGSLLTATAAADRGIPVLAVPGDVRAPGSGAPHRLLAEGAAPCTGPEDLLAALGETLRTSDGDEPGVEPSALPDGVHQLLAQRWPRPIRVDELSAQLDVPAATLLAGVTRARLAGEIAEGPD
ncbi:MAG: DNA-processing protein DprA, partial [Nitriliruptorales bacterium]|nr:DNA-processing protein DprA [Nitriliruptorales bacterium]